MSSLRSLKIDEVSLSVAEATWRKVASVIIKEWAATCRKVMLDTILSPVESRF
jgi:hypothetical protein